MNKYEGLFIFPESLKDDTLEAAITRVRTEIEKQGGEVDAIARMGRKVFARPIKKQSAGNYVVMNLQLEGVKLSDLTNRLKLVEDVVRVQFLTRPEEEPVPVAPAVADADEDEGEASEVEEETNAVS